ncbi:MAG TPA: amidohydrolase family protein [Candidatus Sulfopaludibacter sp.]|nr:amidohydrolase family protein [Candidatus Sulfopaludibacter sp.]
MKLAALSLSCALAALAGANDTFLMRNVDVYPVTAKEMKGVSILVQDGRIAEIGPKITAPKGVRVVDGKGLRVYPGLIDSATNLGLQEIGAVRETVDTGELGDFMPQLHALVAVNPESEHFGAVRVNGITSAITLPGGGGGRGGGGSQWISGQAALIHTSGYTWEEMNISKSAALQLNFPSLGGRGGRGGMPPDIAEMMGLAAGAAGGANARRTYQENIARINAFFDDARHYKAAKAAHPAGFTTDLKLEAMIPVLDGKVPVAVSASTAETMHDAIQFADKQHVRIVIMGPRELGSVGPELKSHNIPVILGRVLALPEREDDSYDAAMALPSVFYKAGVKFAFGTFTNEFVRNLPFQAAAAVGFGLPADEALKAVTINPAEIWGVADQIGSLDKGKWADLLVTNGDPLEIQTKVEHVYIKGKEIELSNKQTRLYDKYMSRQ